MNSFSSWSQTGATQEMLGSLTEQAEKIQQTSNKTVWPALAVAINGTPEWEKSDEESFSFSSSPIFHTVLLFGAIKF